MGKNFMGYNNASELITAIGNKIKAKYSKPSGGIPKSDLATGVQSSLEKADSALQSYTETDPTVPSWAKASSKPTYTQDEVGDGSTYKRVTSTEKNTWNSKYSKPSGGIPKTDLASAVQTSLGLADGALQHTTLTGSPDLDTYLTTGVYHIATSTAAHAPTTNHATLFVDGTVGTPYQIFKPDNVDSPWYTRHRSGSAWTSWVAMKFTDTTYSAATTSAAGLMSAADKTKLNGIATGAQVNSITGVKGNSESSYRTGNVNLTAANIGAVPNTAAGVSAAINQLTTGDSAPTDNDYYVSQYAGGGTSTTTYHRRPVSKLWDYIKSKFSLSTTGSGNAVTGVSYSNGAFTVTKGSSFAASSHTHNYAGSSSAGGSAFTADKLKLKSVRAQAPVKGWSTKTWSGLTAFAGIFIWTDGTNIYYSSASDQYVLNKSTSTWTRKTWSGLTSFSGNEVWTDGSNIYYSSYDTQYVLNGSTWTKKTWSGMTSFYADSIWTDGTNIYYSSGSTQRVLNGSTWSTKTWSGLTGFNRQGIWTDGTDIYHSYYTDHYVLNRASSTWTRKTWSGLTSFMGDNVWTDGSNIYCSAYDTQYVLNGSTWSTKTWPGLSNFYGSNLWTDGDNIYCADGSTQYVLADKKSVR